MTNGYAVAWDTLTKAIAAADGKKHATIDDADKLTPDQQIAVAQVAALLSIAEEISALNPNNTYSFDADGQKINAWGFPMP